MKTINRIQTKQFYTQIRNGRKKFRFLQPF
nr:MAG TPA_asm: hypothetical protein [Caudoviricetes sp.]